MVPKAQITLNTRNLYKSDGSAVRELLKISSLLCEAKAAPGKEIPSIPAFEIAKKMTQLKSARHLAGAIGEKGSDLFDKLGSETTLRESRNQVITKPFELNVVEKSVMESVRAVEEKLKISMEHFETLQADEANLNSKIAKKRQEFERAEKRLKSLQSVRPAYMDEYEKIERDLVSIYEEYIEKFRNMAYLEQQLDEHIREEQNKFEEAETSMKKMQNKLREQELSVLRGNIEELANNSRLNRPVGANSKSRLQPQENSNSSGESEDFEYAISSGSEVSSEASEEEFENDGSKNQNLGESDVSSMDLLNDDDGNFEDTNF